LLRAPIKPLKFHTRWADWESQVLCRLDNAELCQDTILARQQDLDVEQDEANLILEHFERQLAKNQQRDCDRVFISTGTVADWLNAALGEKWSKVSASRFLNQKINEGRVRRLVRAIHPERFDRSTHKGRGYWWVPVGWSEDSGATVRPRILDTFNVAEDWDFRFGRE
jgi:hypothetical protein